MLHFLLVLMQWVFIGIHYFSISICFFNTWFVNINYYLEVNSSTESTLLAVLIWQKRFNLIFSLHLQHLDDFPNILKRNLISRTKVIVYKAVCVSLLLYGCESHCKFLTNSMYPAYKKSWSLLGYGTACWNLETFIISNLACRSTAMLHWLSHLHAWELTNVMCFLWWIGARERDIVQVIQGPNQGYLREYVISSLAN